MNTTEVNPFMNEILSYKFEWVWKGAVKDFNAYIKIPSNYCKIHGKENKEINGIFLNKLKTRLAEAFGNNSYAVRLKTSDLIIYVKSDEKTNDKYYEIESITYIGENFTTIDEFLWFMKFTSNYFPMSMCSNSKLGTLQQFLESTIIKPAKEELEVEVEEDWSDTRANNDVY